MARFNISEAARYAVVVGGGYIGYRMAITGALGGSAKKFAEDFRGALVGGGSAPIAAPPSGGAPRTPSNPPVLPSGLVATTLTDLGSFPIVYDLGRRTLRQDPARGGTNIYAPGDVFTNDDGFRFQWLGGDVLQPMDGGSAISVNAFMLAQA